ncbi:MAG: hypothetical protein FJZ78_06290 [Bacteroidetes bacterium]|nr:hypothetical protein [Bacteroidota bacterium]
MKNRYLALIFAVATLVVTDVVAQQGAVLRVIAKAGQTSLKTGSGAEPIKSGALLQSTDVVVIGPNSYLSLIPHGKAGKGIELRNPGSYTVNDLAKGQKDSPGLVNKYTDFILASNSPEAKKNRMSATGAVHRGLNDIDVFLPEARTKGNFVLGNSVVIGWEAKTASAGPYEVKILNLSDDLLARHETSDNKLRVDLPTGESFVVIVVTKKGDSRSSSEPFSIQRLDPASPRDKDQTAKLQNELKELDLNEETALNKYILAGFFEEQNLLIDAIVAYEDAIRLAPEVDTYREAYEEFLLRKQLKDAKK